MIAWLFKNFVYSICKIKKNWSSKKQKERLIKAIRQKIGRSKANALIVAAGLGSRVKSHTENLPKCMLDFGGKTLLERQLLAYRSCGIDNISVIRGYKKNKLFYRRR